MICPYCKKDTFYQRSGGAHYDNEGICNRCNRHLDFNDYHKIRDAADLGHKYGSEEEREATRTHVAHLMSLCENHESLGWQFGKAILEWLDKRGKK